MCSSRQLGRECQNSVALSFANLKYGGVRSWSRVCAHPISPSFVRPGRLCRHLPGRHPERESMIGVSPSVAAATVTTLRAVDARVRDVPPTALDVVATILVMDVATAAVAGIASRQGDQRSFPREVSLTTVPLRGLGAACASLDAHRMPRIRDAVGLYRATGQAHFCLNVLAMQPKRQTEHDGLAPSVSRHTPLLDRCILALRIDEATGKFPSHVLVTR